jgi:two-component system sensor histidine kinase QseC
VRQGVAPLRRLGGTLARRTPDALQPIAVNGAPSEMVPMLDALNGLFTRIAELLESERRFTADAAHELRTPIASIRAQAQVALGATADSERSHALHATLQGCDRATRLVEQLLTLSRLESWAQHAPVAVDLAVDRGERGLRVPPQHHEPDQPGAADAEDPEGDRGDDREDAEAGHRPLPDRHARRAGGEGRMLWLVPGLLLVMLSRLLLPKGPPAAPAVS